MLIHFTVTIITNNYQQSHRYEPSASYSSSMMEPIGNLVTVGRSKNLGILYVYNSVRKPGFVYEWNLLKGKKFQCCGCTRLKKMRCIGIENGVLLSSGKHPEDDHHDQCQPVPEAGIYSQL